MSRTDADRVARMFGIEFPRQLRRDVGVEADRHRVAQHLRLGRRGDRIVALRRAAKPGHAAEEIVERHRGKAEANHRKREQTCHGGGLRVGRHARHHW